MNKRTECPNVVGIVTELTGRDEGGGAGAPYPLPGRCAAGFSHTAHILEVSEAAGLLATYRSVLIGERGGAPSYFSKARSLCIHPLPQTCDY